MRVVNEPKDGMCGRLRHGGVAPPTRHDVQHSTLSWAECQNAFRTHPNEDGCGIHGTSGIPTGLRYVAFWQKMSWNANRGTATGVPPFLDQTTPTDQS